MLKRLICTVVCLGVLGVSGSAYWFAEGESVYITPSGECYHQETCGYVGDAWTELPYGQAVSMGYRACSWCVEEDNDEWEQYGDWLWYNPFITQWRDEDGNLYGDPSEAYMAQGYTYVADSDIWVNENGYLVDGSFYPYPEDVPDYCYDCENIIEDRYSDHDEECPSHPDNQEEATVIVPEETPSDPEEEQTTWEKVSEFMEEQSLYAFFALFGIPLALYLYNKAAKKIFKM